MSAATRKARFGISLLSRAETAGLERAHWAEAKGFDSVWVPDGDGKMHALTLAGAVAATTQRITLGTGIVPIYTHTPAVLAASASALAHLAPGRVIIGLGVSSQAMMERWNGIPFTKPLARARETVQALRAMLQGERVELDGEALSTHGFRLATPPQQPVPIYLAALRPKMLELTGEVADGAILNMVPLPLLPTVLEHLAAGARRAGRSLADLDVLLRFNTVIGDDRAAGLETARQFMVRYFAAGVYNKYFAWCGYPDEARAFADAFARGDRAATASAMSDALLSEICLVGDETTCQARVRQFIEGGVNTVVINPLVTTIEDTDRTMDAFNPRHFA